MSSRILLGQRRRRIYVPDPGGGGGGGGGGIIGQASHSDSLITHPLITPLAIGNLYVAATGSDSNPGTFAQPFATIGKALSAVSDGQTILIRAGTYTPPLRLTRSVAWSTGIRVQGYGDELPIIDGSALGTGAAGRILYFLSGSRRERWANLIFRNAKDRTIDIEGQQIHLGNIYIYDSAGTGIHIGNFGGGAGNNIVQDFAVWKLGDGSSTGTNVPDGIAATANNGITTNGNAFVRGFVANGPDDGYDLFRSNGGQIIDCVALACGYYWTGNPGGDGSGFKAGGPQPNSGNNTVRGSFTQANRVYGFNDNDATLPIAFRFNTAVSTGWGYLIGPGDSMTDNIKFDSAHYPPADASPRNSWTLGISNPHFESDYSLAGDSAALGVGQGGDNIGASDLALALYAKWVNHSQVWLPGRGLGPGGTGLPGDT